MPCAQLGLHDFASPFTISSECSHLPEVIKRQLQRNVTRWATILHSGKRYTGKAFYVTAAIEITCHDYSMLYWDARDFILLS